MTTALERSQSVWFDSRSDVSRPDLIRLDSVLALYEVDLPYPFRRLGIGIEEICADRNVAGVGTNER